jgi:hypothetical protein
VAIAVPIAAALLLWRLTSAARPAADWPASLKALDASKTMHGRGLCYLKDGTAWEYALWVRVRGPGDYQIKGLSRRVRPGPEEVPLPSAPDPQFLELCGAMTYCGDGGVLTRLAHSPTGRVRGRTTEWQGRPASEFQFLTGEVLAESERDRYPDAWTFIVDPETGLVLASELFTVENGVRRLRARCSYEYGEPLPAGFEEAPG